MWARCGESVTAGVVRPVGPRAARGEGRRGGRRTGDRDLMVIHGSDDETVPVLDARAVADACPGADLRIIGGAGHHLRHDPRAVAVLIGWLEARCRSLLA